MGKVHSHLFQTASSCVGGSPFQLVTQMHRLGRAPNGTLRLGIAGAEKHYIMMPGKRRKSTSPAWSDGIIQKVVQPLAMAMAQRKNAKVVFR